MIRVSTLIGAVAGWVLPVSIGYATSGAVASTGLTVDTSSRASVVAFWNLYYEPIESAEAIMSWTGSYGAVCDPGDNSLAFTEAIERRINFYRAMAGVGGDTLTNSGSTVVVNPSDTYKPTASTTKQSAAQRAALMFSYAGELSHNPPPSLPFSCWSSAAWNAADKANLALGFHGLEAIDAYMRENDPQSLAIWNSGVGHRRWILIQGATDFASGDVPGESPHRQASNVLYVMQGAGEMVAVTPKFASWPSAGCFPDELMAKQWSLSHPDADFSSATVSMTDPAGSPVSISIVDQTSSGLGDPAIVWSVPDAVAQTSVLDDTTYHVTVSGIDLDGQTVSHSYSVTVIDPDVIPDDLDLTGTTTPPLAGANYFFEPVDGADSHAVVASISEAVTWTVGAEDSDEVQPTDGTSAGYDLRSGSGHIRSGGKAFRLAFPSVSELDNQTFTIEREVIAGSGGQLQYYLRRGYVTAGMVVEVLTSSDGLAWTTVDSIPGTAVDGGFNLRTVALPEGEPVKVRFQMRYGGGSIYIASQHPLAGAFVDDVSFSNCQWTIAQSEVMAGEGDGFVRVDSASLDPSPSAGDSVSLRLKATLGGRAYMTPAPLAVTFVVGTGDFHEWMTAEYPQVSGGFEDDHDADGLSNGLEYAFGLSPVDRSSLPQLLSVDGSTLQLTTPLTASQGDILYEMEVSSDLSGWDSTGVSVQHSGGELIGTATLPGGKGFARWKVTQP